jgi:hypothetical protein
MATALYNNVGLKPFILSEGPGLRSRDEIIVTQTGTAIESGQLLTKVDTGTAAFAMDAGATGNPTSGAITVGAAAMPGAYVVEFTAATKFTVEAPDGVTIGTGTVGTAFNKGGLTFTLTAGGTAAVAGDTAKITVQVGSGKYVAYTANGAAGSADAVLYKRLPAATGDVKAVGITRDAEVSAFQLTNLDATARIGLAAQGIVVRGNTNVLGVATPAL